MDYQTAVGDILLVTGEAKRSAALVAAQKALYPSARASHVAISLGGGAFIHSTIEKGVHLAYFPDVIEGCSNDWRVIRLKGLTKENERLLLGATNYHLTQSYNFRYMMPGTSHSSFCSELAAKAYERAGIPILQGRAPSTIAPAHFDEQADTLTHWDDVTQDYRALLDEIGADPDLHRVGFAYLAYRLERLRAVNARTEMKVAIALSLCKSEESRQSIMRMKDELDSKKLFNYWDLTGDSNKHESAS